MNHKSMSTLPDEEKTKQPIAPSEEEEEDIEALAEPPDWLPDGWIMEVYRGNDGAINRYYTSPISGYTFNMTSEAWEYLFSQTDERMLESKESRAEKTIQQEHEWLPKGWVMEIRAGGENMDKMYKFYVYPKNALRLQTKEDVALYVNERKISNFDTSGECDTRSQDNLLAIVDFYPSGLPEGWVRELVFRKTKEGLIRRDPYYTDPASSYTFRTLKSALCFVETGKISKRAFIQRISVHDLYCFEKSTDLHESLRSRLIINETPFLKSTRSSRSKGTLLIEYDQSIKNSQDGDTSSGSDGLYEPEEKIKSRKAKGKEAISSRTTINRPTRRPVQLRIKDEVDTD